jgi:hypothetical protein
LRQNLALRSEIFRKPRRRHAAHLDLFPEWLKGSQTLLNLWPYAHHELEVLLLDGRERRIGKLWGDRHELRAQASDLGEGPLESVELQAAVGHQSPR